MDFSRMHDMTDGHQAGSVLCGGRHGHVASVAIVDVSDVIPRVERSGRVAFGYPVSILYGIDENGSRLCACLSMQIGGESVEIAFAPVGELPSPSAQRVLMFHTGLSIGDAATLYLACVPDRLKRSVRDSGVAV